jgi:nucleolar protein 9
MAKDKYASHIVDKCWMSADINLKEQMAQMLKDNQRQLSNFPHGRAILSNCRIDEYRRSKGQWKERQLGMERKKDLFADIVGEKRKR